MSITADEMAASVQLREAFYEDIQAGRLSLGEAIGILVYTAWESPT